MPEGIRSMRFVTALVITLSAAMFVAYHAVSFPAQAEIEIYSAILESLIALCTLGLIFVLQLQKPPDGIYRLLMVGLTLLLASQVTDGLDEFYMQPELFSLILEKVVHIVGQVLVISGICLWMIHNQRLHGELEQLSITDPLTQLLNRRGFQDKAVAEFQRGKRYNNYFSLMLVDIDHFKSINDTHGHASGDLILKQFADKLTASLRKTDYVARWGGEEFVILLPEDQPADVLNVAEKLRMNINQGEFFTADEQPLDVTASIGLGILTYDDNTVEVVLQRADEALYQAKSAGRNRVKLVN